MQVRQPAASLSPPVMIKAILGDQYGDVLERLVVPRLAGTARAMGLASDDRLTA